MSKVRPQPAAPKASPPFLATAPQDAPPPAELPRPVKLMARVRCGNNEYDLVELTFLAPSSSRVVKSGLSRMEVDYELRLSMQHFVGPDRLGPSAEWP